MPSATKAWTAPPWTISDLFQVFVLIAALMIVVLSVADYVFSDGAIFGHWPQETITGILYVAQSITLLAPLFLFTKLKHKSDWTLFGFHKIAVKKILVRIAQGYLFYYLISAVFFQIKMSFQTEIPGYGEQLSHIPLFGSNPVSIVLGGIIIIFIAPLIEELFFRGYVQQIFKKYTNAVGGGIGSALIFTLFHFEFQIFIPIFILGLLLSWLFERTGSIWTPICFHMINNGLAFLIEVAIFYEWIYAPI